MQELPRRFVLMRDEDVTGVSGTGVVATGVEFPDGRTVMRWCVKGKPNSITMFDSIPEALEVHGHDGRTSIHMVADSIKRVEPCYPMLRLV